MKTYDVTIKATVYKTIRIEAEDEDAAYVEAHERFSVTEIGPNDDYDEETMDIEEIAQ